MLNRVYWVVGIIVCVIFAILAFGGIESPFGGAGGGFAGGGYSGRGWSGGYYYGGGK